MLREAIRQSLLGGGIASNRSRTRNLDQPRISAIQESRELRLAQENRLQERNPQNDSIPEEHTINPDETIMDPE